MCNAADVPPWWTCGAVRAFPQKYNSNCLMCDAADVPLGGTCGTVQVFPAKIYEPL
jgi:hypothetical protein